MSLPGKILAALRNKSTEQPARPAATAGANEATRETVIDLPIAPPYPLSREAAEKLVKSFPYWYHRIYLGNGVYTLPGRAHHELVWDVLKPAVPDDLHGASVLDIGCNAGYFAIQLRQRGSGRTLGIESVPEHVQQADLIKPIWGAPDIEYRVMDVHQVNTLQEEFELVIFLGILYHLENPLQVLREVGRICKDAILVETEIIPEDSRNCIYVRQGPYGNVRLIETRKGFMKFIESTELNGDGSNWWVPDTECLFGMLRTAGFKYFSKPIYFTEGRLAMVASKKSGSSLDWQALR